METRASTLLVGSFVLLLVAGLVGFVVWLGKVQFDQAFTRYDIYFTGNVSGLRVGSTVSYRGVPVGEVIDVGVDPDNLERVLTTIEVPAETPIRSDTVASLQLQGITGGINVFLSGGTQGAAPLVPAAGQDRAVILSEVSTLEKLFDDAPALVDSLQVLMTRAAAVLSQQNQVALTQTLDNLNLLTGALADRIGDVQLVLNDAAGTMANVRDASAEFETLAKNLNTLVVPLAASAAETLRSVENTAESLDGEEIGAVIADIRQAVQSFDQMAEEIRALAAENREPLLQFSTGTLIELTTFLAEARGLITGLNRVTTEVQRDPARFLFGNQQQGYEPGG